MYVTLKSYLIRDNNDSQKCDRRNKEMPIVIEERKRPVCGKCRSGFVYMKKKGTIIACRSCGAETDKDTGDEILRIKSKKNNEWTEKNKSNMKGD